MQKGNITVTFLLCIFLVILVVGGYYFLNKSTNSGPVVFPKPKEEQNLKTYTNQNLGLEFKYQKELIAKEDSEEDFNKRGGGDFRKNFKGYVGYEPGKFIGGVMVLDKDNSYDKNPFTVWVFDNPDNLTIDGWYDKYWYYPFVWGDFTYQGKTVFAPKDEATVSGQTAKSGMIDYQPGKPKFVYLSSDGKMYLFRIIGETGEKILSTFKFLSVKQAGGECVVGGCSGQLCLQVVEGQEAQIVSTCEWREEYSCYKSAKCERQSNGECGWTKTEELTKCLQEKSIPANLQ